MTIEKRRRVPTPLPHATSKLYLRTNKINAHKRCRLGSDGTPNNNIALLRAAETALMVRRFTLSGNVREFS